MANMTMEEFLKTCCHHCGMPRPGTCNCNVGKIKKTPQKRRSGFSKHQKEIKGFQRSSRA